MKIYLTENGTGPDSCQMALPKCAVIKNKIKSQIYTYLNKISKSDGSFTGPPNKLSI